MRIIIDIPEDAFKLLNDSGVDWLGAEHILGAVANGTPLPKGHGRIADIDKVLEEMKATRTYDIPFALERVKPIIEADRTESEG